MNIQPGGSKRLQSLPERDQIADPDWKQGIIALAEPKDMDPPRATRLVGFTVEKGRQPFTGNLVERIVEDVHWNGRVHRAGHLLHPFRRAKQEVHSSAQGALKLPLREGSARLTADIVVKQVKPDQGSGFTQHVRQHECAGILALAEKDRHRR